MTPLGSSLAALDGIRQMQASYRRTYDALRGPADHVRLLQNALKVAELTRLTPYENELKALGGAEYELAPDVISEGIRRSTGCHVGAADAVRAS